MNAQRLAVDGDVGEERQAERLARPQTPGEQMREADADHGSGHREHNAFRQQLTNDATATGAEREPQRDLPAAAGGPRQQQVREVRADDEDDEPDGAPEHGQRAAKRAVDVRLQRREAHAAACPNRGAARVSRAMTCVISACALSIVTPGFEPCDHRERVAPAAHVVEDGGQEHLDALARCEHRGEVEARRQDADDGVRGVVDGDGAADDGRVTAEAPLPEPVREQHDLRAIGRDLLGRERAARAPAARRAARGIAGRR